MPRNIVYCSLRSSIEMLHTDAEAAIYNQLEPMPSQKQHCSQEHQLLKQLLDVLASAGCLSAQGRVLRAWISVNGGAPLASGSGDIQRITNRLGISQIQHVTTHLVAISTHFVLGEHFKYNKLARYRKNESYCTTRKERSSFGDSGQAGSQTN